MDEQTDKIPTALLRILNAINDGRKWADQLPSAVRVAFVSSSQDPASAMGGWTLSFPDRVVRDFYSGLARAGCCVYIVDQELLQRPGTKISDRLGAEDYDFFISIIDTLISSVTEAELPNRPYIVTQGHVNFVLMIDDRHTLGRVSSFPSKAQLNAQYLGHVAGMEGGIGFYDAANNRLTIDYELSAEAVRDVFSRITACLR